MVTQTQIPLPLVELLVVKRSTQCTASLTRSHFVVYDDDVDYDDDDDDDGMMMMTMMENKGKSTGDCV